MATAWVLALAPDLVEFLPGKPGGQFAGKRTDHGVDAIDFGQAFQAGPEVDGVANDGVTAANIRAHVAHTHAAGVQPDPYANFRQALAAMLFIELAHGLHHLQRGLDRQRGVFRRLDGRTPEGHHAVTHVLVEGAAVAADQVREPAEDAVEQSLQLRLVNRMGRPWRASRAMTGTGRTPLTRPSRSLVK